MSAIQKEIMTEKNKFNKEESQLLWVVCCALFTIPLTITSSSILNLSVISRFDVNYYQAQWFITLFMIFYASFMAVTGSLADIFGRKKIFMIGLFLLFVGFFVGGFTDQYGLLLITRAACGIGAAAITTSGTALLAANLRPNKKEKAFSIFGCALGIGMVCGPLVADYASQWANGFEIFPLSMSSFCLFILFLSFGTIDKGNKIKVSVDWFGGIALTTSLLLTVLALSFMPIWGCFAPKSLFCLFGGLGFFAIFIFFQKKLPNPIVNIDILKIKKFRAMCITTLLLGFGYVSLLFYFPYYLKINSLLSDVSIGWVATLATVPSLVLPILISKFKQKFSNINLLCATFICLIVGPIALCVVAASHNLFSYIIPLLIFGSSFGISLSFIDGEAVNSVDFTQAGVAAGTFNTFRIGGESLSIPLLGFIVSIFDRYGKGASSYNFSSKINLVSISHFSFSCAMTLTLIIVSLVCALFSYYVMKTMIYRKQGA